MSGVACGRPRILVVRRDNIGDLVCTTPLFSAIRQRYPEGWLGALVNSYNAPVLEGNSDLDEVFAYAKGKHLSDGESAIGAMWSRIHDLIRIRRLNLDWVVLATTTFSERQLRLARWLAPNRIAGVSDGSAAARRLSASVAEASLESKHEVERVFSLVSLLGIDASTPPAPRVVPNPARVAQARAAFGATPAPRIAIQISARRPTQRWPADRYAALIERLRDHTGGAPMLLWAPGAPNHPAHPGDDDKAVGVVDRLASASHAIPYPTRRLADLIAALAASELVVTPDGGAMHLAAALGKPVVALFGDSPPERWKPWGHGHSVVQGRGSGVQDISVDEVRQAVVDLLRSH